MLFQFTFLIFHGLAAFLIIIIGIDAPEIMARLAENILGSQHTHEYTVILVIVLEGSIAADAEKTLKSQYKDRNALLEKARK